MDNGFEKDLDIKRHLETLTFGKGILRSGK
jgi:hypothetical protein